MDSLKFHPGPPCPSLLRPAGGPHQKPSYGCYRGGPPTKRVACGRLLPFWTPHVIRYGRASGQAACHADHTSRHATSQHAALRNSACCSDSETKAEDSVDWRKHREQQHGARRGSAATRWSKTCSFWDKTRTAFLRSRPLPTPALTNTGGHLPPILSVSKR
jgi:hypothetical protein